MAIEQSKVDAALERANKNFVSGLNCSESVYEAFIHAGIVDMPQETVALATGFGGGCGMTGNQCGGLNGCVMALGAFHGRRDPYAIEESVRKTSLHLVNQRAFNTLVNYFISKYGSVRCRDLCGLHGGYTSPERKDFCINMVQDMILKTVELMNMSEEELKKLPYGFNMGNYE